MGTTRNTLEMLGAKTGQEVFGVTTPPEDAFSPVLPKGDFVLEEPSGTTPARATYYNDTYVLDIEWDDKEPVLSKEQSKRSYPAPENYQSDGKRTVNSMYFADVLGISQEDAYTAHDQIAREFFDADDTPDGYFERIGNRFKNGVQNVKTMEAGNDFLVRFVKGEVVDIEKELAEIVKLQSKINVDESKKTRAWHEKMIGATAEQLPILAEGLKGGIKGGLAGAGSGALSAIAIGAVIPAPEEVITVPASALFGAKVGGAVGAGASIAKLKSGELFTTLLSVEDENGNKIDPKIAAIVAISGGVVEGAIEVGEIAIIASTLGIGTKVFESSARRVTAKFLVEGTLKNVIAKNLLKFGGALTVETAQELAQEASSIFHEELAKEINNELKGTDIPHVTPEQIKERLAETGIEALRGFPLLLAPGTAISTVRQGVQVKGAKEVVAEDTDTGETETEVLSDITEDVSIDDAIQGISESLGEKQGFERSIPDIKRAIIDPATVKIQPAKPLEAKQEAVTADQIKSLPDDQKIDAIINRPVEIDEDGVVDEELDAKDKAAIKSIEADIAAEDAEVVSPQLHIGNVTQRQKKVFAEIFSVEPEDVRGFISEEGFPTKKTGIEMTKGQAKEYLSFLEEDLVEKLENNKINTENQLARANADWGDIKAVREVLGEKQGKRPFTVVRAGKHEVRAILDPKERIKQAIRPTEDANLTIGQVLNSTLKRVAQAARHAFAVGKKEGIAQTKEHFREVKQRLKDRQALKDRINKALKRINKPSAGNVDFFYAEAVDTLRREIDPKKRTNRTKQRRQRQRDFLEQASPEEIKSFPQRLFDSLNAKPLNDITIAELEELAVSIDKLKKLGKTKFKAKNNAAKLVRDRNIKQSISAMNNGRAFPEQPSTGAQRNSEGLIKKLNSLFLLTLRMPRILDWIDGGKGTFKGKMHDLFYNRVNTQTNDELVQVDRRSKSMRDNMDNLGITDDELTREIPFDSVRNGLGLLVEEVMGVYSAMKNPKAKEAMLAQLRISEKTALAIVTNLEAKFIRLADVVIDDYADSYGRLRAAHIDFTNEDVGRELFYTPMVRLEVNGQNQNNDIVDQLLARQGLRRTQTAKGFTIDRETVAPENQKPIDLRLMSVWRAQSAKQEHYTHFASLVKDLNGYLADDSFKKAINAKLGKAAHGILKGYVARVASPDSYKGFSTLEVTSRKLRGNIAMAYLSYNLLTVLKQAPSMALYLKDAGAANIMSSIGEFITDPKALLEKVRSKDPQVQHNLIAREFAQLQSSNDPTYKKLIRKVGQAGLEGIKFVDAVVRSIGWNAVYTKELQLNGSEMEAIREAQNSTLRTQPTASAKDIAALYTQNEVFNWFLMFTQQLNQIWNITTYDTFANWNNKNYQAAATDMLAVSLSAMFIWMISNKRLPEDEEDFLDIASDQFINMVPLIGKDIMGGKKGWGGAEVAPFKAAKDISKAVFSGDMEAAALEVIKQSAAANGVPIVAIKRLAEFLETGEPIELIGGKR